MINHSNESLNREASHFKIFEVIFDKKIKVLADSVSNMKIPERPFCITLLVHDLVALTRDSFAAIINMRPDCLRHG